MSALVMSGIARESEAVNAAFQMNCEEHVPLNLSEVKVSHASFGTINMTSRNVFIIQSCLLMGMIHVDIQG